jgi:hypothetical protein
MIVGAPTSPHPWCDPKGARLTFHRASNPGFADLAAVRQKLLRLACVGHFEFGIACIAAI